MLPTAVQALAAAQETDTSRESFPSWTVGVDETDHLVPSHCSINGTLLSSSAALPTAMQATAVGHETAVRETGNGRYLEPGGAGGSGTAATGTTVQRVPSQCSVNAEPAGLCSSSPIAMQLLADEQETALRFGLFEPCGWGMDCFAQRVPFQW